MAAGKQVLVVLSNGCRGNNTNNKSSDDQNMVAVLISTIKKSVLHCKINGVLSPEDSIDIGWPTEVRHVAHVTFDRHNGFLGLPDEFEEEVSSRSAPSASASVFGVSAGIMQCGLDCKGNSVPIILLLMQERLYSLGGLKAEGIFRINPENSEEKDLRNQLNKGIIPDDIDVHCLAGLIKAWFRELPEGVLDSLSPAQVLECEDEEDCVALVKLLPPMESALVHWVVDLMADVVEEEDVNKMNARNIAMVFAPNMTQLSDPLTSLMHAVQVMNLLQTLIFRTLREREEFSFSPSLDLEDDYDSQARSSVVECEIVEEIQECFFRHLELEEAENQEATRSSDVSIVTSESDTSSRTVDFVSDLVAVVCEDEEEPIETADDCNEMEMAVDANNSNDDKTESEIDEDDLNLVSEVC